MSRGLLAHAGRGAGRWPDCGGVGMAVWGHSCSAISPGCPSRVQQSSRGQRGATISSATCQRAPWCTAGSRWKHRPVGRQCIEWGRRHRVWDKDGVGQATASSVRSCRAPASGGADAARRQATGAVSCRACPPCHQRRIRGRVTLCTHHSAIERAPAPRCATGVWFGRPRMPPGRPRHAALL